MEKLEEFYIKHIPSGWVVMLIAAFFFTGAIFWLIEEYLGMSHDPQWYDMVHLMAFIAVGAFTYYVGESTERNYRIKSYRNAEELRSDDDLMQHEGRIGLILRKRSKR